MHEPLGHDEDVKVGSERSFGIVFAVVFAVIAGYIHFVKESDGAMYLFAVSGAFLVAAFAFAQILRPLNIIWFKFGMALGRVTGPIIMGILFFGTITPMALIMRLAGRDYLRLKINPGNQSYWIPRDPPGPSGDSLTKQF